MENAKKTFVENIANLFKVKTILSLLVIVTTCILTFKNQISVEGFMAIASAVITYYFTKTENNKDNQENRGERNGD